MVMTVDSIGISLFIIVGVVLVIIGAKRIYRNRKK